MPHQVPNRRSLVNYGTCYLQHPLGVPQSPSSSIDEAPFRVLGGSRFRASSVGRCGFDFLKCQTFAASPAEPGELLFWFSARRIPLSGTTPFRPIIAQIERLMQTGPKQYRFRTQTRKELT